jgi:hypothetical protein
METDEKPLPITQLGDSISLSLEQDEKLPFPVDSNNDMANTHRKALVENLAIESSLENTKSALTQQNDMPPENHHVLPTPELTPDPSDYNNRIDTYAQEGKASTTKQLQNSEGDTREKISTRARQDGAAVDPANTLSGSRATRGTRPAQYREGDKISHAIAAFIYGQNPNRASRLFPEVSISQISTLSGGGPNLFAMAITSHTRSHHSTLPSPPLSWKKMLLHPEKHGFLIAAQAEYDSLC